MKQKRIKQKSNLKVTRKNSHNSSTKISQKRHDTNTR